MPGGGDTVGGGLRTTDDSSGAFLPGETACPGKMHGGRRGDGARVSGSPSTDAAR